MKHLTHSNGLFLLLGGFLLCLPALREPVRAPTAGAAAGTWEYADLMVSEPHGVASFHSAGLSCFATGEVRSDHQGDNVFAKLALELQFSSYDGARVPSNVYQVLDGLGMQGWECFQYQVLRGDDGGPARLWSLKKRTS